MKRIVTTTGLTAIVLAIGSGCTTVVKYDLTNFQMSRPDVKRQDMKVVVAPLMDIRSSQEKNPPITQKKLQTADKKFKDGDISRGVSEALAKHFNHIKLFKITEVASQSDALRSADILKKMNSLGYDALLTGKIEHFYGAGYATEFDRLAIGLAMIPITVLVTYPIMLLQENLNEGYVAITDAQLTDTATGNILWSGSFSKKIETKYKDMYPEHVAGETLKEIANEMVKQIETASFK